MTDFNKRPTIDEYYLKIALDVAARATCLRKHYGAVIVKDKLIVSSGYNGVPYGEPHCTCCSKVKCDKDVTEYLSCKSIHAEMNSIIQASRKDMVGGTLYLAGTDSDGNEINARPCEICLRLIKNAGIQKVVNKSGVIYERDSEGLLQEVKND